jgi:hypothetical protein
MLLIAEDRERLPADDLAEDIAFAQQRGSRRQRRGADLLLPGERIVGAHGTGGRPGWCRWRARR